MHFRAITRIVGLLVILFSGTMIIPGLVALDLPGWSGPRFYPDLFCRPRHWLYAVVAEPQREGRTEPREGFLIVVLFWTVLGSVGALPFIFSESPNLTITDAFFESFLA